MRIHREPECKLFNLIVIHFNLRVKETNQKILLARDFLENTS